MATASTVSPAKEDAKTRQHSWKFMPRCIFFFNLNFIADSSDLDELIFKNKKRDGGLKYNNPYPVCTNYTGIAMHGYIEKLFPYLVYVYIGDPHKINTRELA